MRLPFRLRLEPVLEDRSVVDLILRVVAGMLVALLIGALILGVSGHDPLHAYRALLRGALGSPRAVANTLNKTVPIGLCAYGIALAYRAGLWNIGAEGQLYMGAFAATGVGLWLAPGQPRLTAIAMVLVAGILAGAAWAAVAALPKAYLGMNEIISTLMLNYVAILWVNYLVFGPWADPRTFSFPYSEPLPPESRLPTLGLSVHSGILLLLLAGLGLALIDRGVRWGYELRVTGDAPQAAFYGGISGRRTIIGALLVSGALAGVAGAIEVAATTGRLQAGLSPGYGFMAILVAWFAAGRPWAIALVSFLYAGLLNGGFSLQVSGIPASIGVILQAALLLGVLAFVALARYRIRVLRPLAQSW